MRLLIIINSLGAGGAEKLVADMAPLFNKKGVDVEILMLRKDNSLFIEDLNKKGIKISCSPYKLYSPRNIFFIRRFIKEFDIIHAHLFPSQYWLPLTFTKKPIIVTEHCTYNKRRSRLIYWPIERFTYGRYKKIVAISAKAKNTLKSWLRISAKRFLVIENGIDLAKFRNASSKDILGIPKNVKKIIMVGRFNPTKDQPTAIKALKYLPDDHHLILVGDGNLRKNCENLALNLGVAERVHFLGIRGDIPELLKSSDITLISSHSEGLSISSIECLASGRPLVTSDVNGLRELNEGVGLLFEDNNYKELANRIISLTRDQELYNEISRKCIAQAMNYDINSTVDKHLNLYNNLLIGNNVARKNLS